MRTQETGVSYGLVVTGEVIAEGAFPSFASGA